LDEIAKALNKADQDEQKRRHAEAWAIVNHMKFINDENEKKANNLKKIEEGIYKENEKLRDADAWAIVKSLKMENDYRDEKAKDRVKMERDIYKDIRGFSQQSYAASISLIATQADAYRAAGVDAVAVAEWVKQETIKAKIAEGKESKFFFDGVRAGLLEMKQNAMTWGQAGYDIFKTFASSSQTAISTILFDGFKGELKSFGDYFSAFWDSMLQTFVNILAQMLTEYALAQAAMGAIKIGGIVGGTTGGVIADVATSVLTKIGAGAVTTGAATAAGGGGASVVTGASTVAGVAGVGTAAGAGGAGGAAGAGAAGTGAMAAAGTAVAVVGAIFAVGKLMEHFLREPGRPWSDVSDQELLAKVPGFYARLQKEEFSPFTSAGPDYEQEELEDTDERMIATQWLTEYTRRHGRPYDPVKGYAMGGILSHASLVVAGEAGPEAIMPLKRGASGQLGVVAAGMGGRDESAALLQAVLDKLLDIIDRYDQWDGRGLLTRTS
ncbi:MAG: hypothetical protein U1B77_01330, partial [Dehalococcoidales bacterium]|nr:hypothetical protein [Dehalococcoidales bacterium]